MEGSGDPTPSVDRRPPERSKAPSKIFWGLLAVALLFSIVGISVVGFLGWKDNQTKVVRLTFKNPQGSPMNQSAVTDRTRNTVTYWVTSRNQTSVVLFDSKHSLVCYRAAGERSCFLRKMEVHDFENIQSILNMSEPKQDEVILQQNNRTRFYREFLGILGSRKVSYELVGEAVQMLCDQLPIYWVKKSEGESVFLLSSRDGWARPGHTEVLLSFSHYNFALGRSTDTAYSMLFYWENGIIHIALFSHSTHGALQGCQGSTDCARVNKCPAVLPLTGSF
ncbi:BRICHOS domain-containing protein 5 isoform X3 [Xenopus tropicalis]|uniref:BRICHOS domain-containing protein 5 isoform X3 n=1 Tax=Xenopus tropicalis TaxID=8364 RepID=A0A8J0R7R8_XENTR|nr:BRICHOS domain-containing protein 5 isoform X3 [Xenopus tropicalis]